MVHLLARYHPQMLLLPFAADVAAGIEAGVVGAVVVIVMLRGEADVIPPASVAAFFLSLFNLLFVCCPVVTIIVDARGDGDDKKGRVGWYCIRAKYSC